MSIADSWKIYNGLLRYYYSNPDPKSRGKFNTDFSAYMFKNATTEEYIPLLEATIDLYNRWDKQPPARDVFLWKTAVVDGYIYPPISQNSPAALSQVPWNIDNHTQKAILPRLSSDLMAKYSRSGRLFEDSTIGIQQNPDMNDCALVASLIALEINGNSGLPSVKSVTQDLYTLNLHFNGSHNRLVFVDISQIPQCGHDTLTLKSNKIEPKVAEIGFLIATRRSFYTCGSNMAIDAYRLTGYLPEVARLGSYNLAHLSKLLNQKICLLGAGTTRLTGKAPGELRQNHDYVITRVDQNSELVYLRDPLNNDAIISLTNKIFEREFSQLYLNWDWQRLFKSTKQLDFIYRNATHNDYNWIFNKPGFVVKNNSSSTERIYILIERHIFSTANKDENYFFIEEVGGNTFTRVDFVAHAHDLMDLQLSKFSIKPSSELRLYCHSSSSNTFTLNLYSITSNISLGTLDLRQNLGAEAEFVPDSTNTNTVMKSENFRVFFSSNDNTTISCVLRCALQDRVKECDISLYHYEDMTESNPLFSQKSSADGYMELPMYLNSNENYRLVCCGASRMKLFLPYVDKGDTRMLFEKLKDLFFDQPYSLERHIIMSNSERHAIVKIQNLTQWNNLCNVLIRCSETSIKTADISLATLQGDKIDEHIESRIHNGSVFIRGIVLPSFAQLIVDLVKSLDVSAKGTIDLTVGSQKQIFIETSIS